MQKLFAINSAKFLQVGPLGKIEQLEAMQLGQKIDSVNGKEKRPA